MCCIFAINENFKKEYPNIAERLMVAHVLSVQYLYEHPYNAGMMFAEGFGTEPEVGIMTVYMKTNAEGRTITWEFTEDNLTNFIDNYYSEDIDEEFIPQLDNVQAFTSSDLLEKSGAPTFAEFMKDSDIDGKFPIGMPFKDWLKKAKEIDGITSDIGDDIEVPEIYEE